jgi:hypothetical protein
VSAFVDLYLLRPERNVDEAAVLIVRRIDEQQQLAITKYYLFVAGASEKDILDRASSEIYPSEYNVAPSLSEVNKTTF